MTQAEKDAVHSMLADYYKMKVQVAADARIWNAVRDEYKAASQYLIDNPESTKVVPCPRAGNMEGSKLISRVPYVPEMELYNADELGLIRYDQFVQQDMQALDSDSDSSDNPTESEEDEDETTVDDANSVDPKVLLKRAKSEQANAERQLLLHRAIHTEFGDGTCTGVSRDFIRVKMSDGIVRKYPKMSVYIITRSTTNGIDMRNELLKQVGEIPLDTPIRVKAEDGPQDKKRKLKGKGVIVEPVVEEEEVAMSAEFDFTILNDLLGIMYRGDSTDTSVISALQGFGFRISPDYVFSKVYNHRILINIFKAWRNKGFQIDMHTSLEFKRIYDAMKSNHTALNSFGFASGLSLKNFYRQEVKVTADNKVIKVYPMIQDGALFIMLPKKGQAGNARAIKVASPGIKWKHGGGADELIKFVKNKAEAKETLKLIKAAGIDITNVDELGDQFKALKLVTRREK